MWTGWPDRAVRTSSGSARSSRNSRPRPLDRIGLARRQHRGGGRRSPPDGGSNIDQVDRVDPGRCEQGDEDRRERQGGNRPLAAKHQGQPARKRKEDDESGRHRVERVVPGEGRLPLGEGEDRAEGEQRQSLGARPAARRSPADPGEDRDHDRERGVHPAERRVGVDDHRLGVAADDFDGSGDERRQRVEGLPGHDPDREAGGDGDAQEDRCPAPPWPTERRGP